MAEAVPDNVSLTEQESALALFCEGMAGQYLHIRAISEWQARAASAATTLHLNHSAQTLDSLYFPETLDTDEPGVYRLIALQQICYRESEAFDFSFARLLEHCPQLEPANNVAMMPRVSDLTLFFSCFSHSGLASAMYHILEYIRMNAYLTRRYPGAARYLRTYHALQQQRLAAFSTGETPVEVRLLQCAFTERWPAEWETHRTALHAPDATVYTSATIVAALFPAQAEVILEWDFLEESTEPSALEWMQREARLEDWQDELATQDTVLAIEMLAAEDIDVAYNENLDGEVREDAPNIRSLKEQRDTLHRRVEMEKSAVRFALGDTHANARSFRYAEWDYLNRRYLANHCRLYELPMLDDVVIEDGAVENLLNIARKWRQPVQTQFEQIRPMGLQRVRRVLDGDELELSAIVEARQDVRAGIQPDERLFSRRERTHRDICTAFLVDLSASTDDPTEPPEPDTTDWDADDYPNLRDPFALSELGTGETEEESRKIIDVQREAMLVMASALERLGDSYGIYGFSGYGHDNVEFYVAKEPRDAFNRRTLEGIAAMKPRRSTRMGPAIRHAVTKLISSGSALKVLMILSDGFPQDSDYGPERGNHEYGLQDTAKALTEARQKGIETFCITVDRSGHDYLKRMCPERRYMVIEEIEDLPGVLGKVYTTLTAR